MTEKIQYDTAKLPASVADRQTSVEVFHLLSEPMPLEALSVDDGRGFPLTSIKAAFILERLSAVFGCLGYGWRYAVGPHHLETAGGKEEVLVEVAVQWRVVTEADNAYCPPVYWQKKTDPATGQIVEGWQYSDKALPYVWSEPIFATGGSSAKRKGSVPLTDAYRSATTNAITKAAARLGVGLEVFKGQDELVSNSAGKQEAGKRQPRQSRASAPKTNKAPAKAGNRFPDLEAIQEAARGEIGKLTFEDVSDQPQAKTVQQLAQKMSTMGFTMQTNRLVHVLLGNGGWSQKGVMAIHNLLLKGQLSEANIALINESAFQ